MVRMTEEVRGRIVSGLVEAKESRARVAREPRVTPGR